jgi:hypothetical protein
MELLGLNQNTLHLIHRHFIIPPIIERRSARRFMRRHLLRQLAQSAVAKILRDTGSTDV